MKKYMIVSHTTNERLSTKIFTDFNEAEKHRDYLAREYGKGFISGVVQEMKIENPYKVNTHHHWDKDMSADLVETIDHRNKITWQCFLFAAGAVTPMRITDFGTCDAAEEWAKNKGAEIWTYFPLDDKRVKHCVRCDNGFVVLDTLPDQTYCSESCWQLDKAAHITRDNEGNIIAGRMRDKVAKEYRPGQTIDIESCIKKDSLDAITKDIYELAQIECTHSNALTYAEIVFIDDNGNEYEYDGVCISEGKLKIAIKSTK